MSTVIQNMFLFWDSDLTLQLVQDRFKIRGNVRKPVSYQLMLFNLTHWAFKGSHLLILSTANNIYT